MTSSYVGSQQSTSRRQSSRSSQASPGQGSALDNDWGALLGVQLSRNIDLETRAGRALLPPGVVDTRPHGVQIVDIREGLRLPEGVVDTRSHSVVTGTPPSPFHSKAAPQAEERVVLDVDTLRVRRVVDHALPAVVTSAAPVPAAMPAPVDEPTPSTVTIQVPPPAVLPTDAPPAPAKASPYQRRSEIRRLEARAARRSSGSLSVPQVGIASALGLATIAAPLSGALTAPSQAGANQLAASSVSAVGVAAPAKPEAAINFPQTVPAAKNAVEAARVVVDDKQVGTVPAALAPPSRLLVTRASRGSAGRAVLPGCDGVVPDSAKKAANGRLPASALCSLWDKDQKLRADAAVAFAKMNVAYKQELGKDICVTDSYRTLGEQYTVKALRGGYAAAPGTSEHGWGLAIDLCGGSSVAGTETFTWLRANSDRYGWENPDWANASLYEPWHWEWSPGRDG